MVMEIPAWLFFSFWALTSITFLHLGFHALDETGLSNSVSPVVISFLKHSLAISSCCSSNYALIFRSQCTYHVDRRYFWAIFGVFYGVFDITDKEAKPFAWGAILCVLMMSSAWLPEDFLREVKIFAKRYSLIVIILFLPSVCTRWYFLIFPLLNLCLIYCANRVTSEVQARIGIHIAVETSLFYVSGKNTMFFPVLVMFVSFLISAYWAALSGFPPFTVLSREFEDECFKELLPVAKKAKEMLLMFKKKKMGKLIGFGIGMMGTLLFQYFFRLTSFDHVVAFLYLAVMWVANLAMLGLSNDSSFLNFLLGNVVVGCTVSQFGLRSKTWFVYGACLLLYGLRLKLESLYLVYRQGEHIKVMIWSDSVASPLSVRVVNESSRVEHDVVQT